MTNFDILIIHEITAVVNLRSRPFSSALTYCATRFFTKAIQQITTATMTLIAARMD